MFVGLVTPYLVPASVLRASLPCLILFSCEPVLWLLFWPLLGWGMERSRVFQLNPAVWSWDLRCQSYLHKELILEFLCVEEGYFYAQLFITEGLRRDRILAAQRNKSKGNLHVVCRCTGRPRREISFKCCLYSLQSCHRTQGWVSDGHCCWFACGSLGLSKWLHIHCYTHGVLSESLGGELDPELQ